VTILRYKPGTAALRDGWFSLVGHYGEPTGIMAWCRAGELLPPPPEGQQIETLLWYVEAAESAIAQIAA
jgi:hypothetical protein